MVKDVLEFQLLKIKKSEVGLRVQPRFQIGLHSKDRVLLELISSSFGVGTIYKQGKESCQLVVSSIKDLEIIISHLDNYPLITQKRVDYLLFKQAIELIKNKEHLSLEG